MSLLTIVQQTQRRVGLPVSVNVVGGTDESAQRLLALANEEGARLKDEFAWQALQTEHTWTATATETQSLAFPPDFDRFIDETFFNRTRKRVVLGPVTAQEWQYAKSVTATVVYDTWRRRGDDMLIIPVPTAGDTYAYEYVTKNWVAGDKSEFTADDDTALVPEDLIALGIRWKWKESKGFDFEADLNAYEQRKHMFKSRDGGARTISFQGCDDFGAPRRVGVPEGSWPL